MLRLVTMPELTAETTDPQGARVVLLRRVWEGKVLRDHPEMAAYVHEVLRTVTAPDRIEPDQVRDERVRYFARNVGPSSWLLVVVSYEQEPARIISAFGTRKDPRS